MSSSSNLPPGWASMRLGDLGEWNGGGTPSKSESSYWTNGSIPWVSPKDMKVLVISDSIDHVTKKAVTESAAKLIPAGSILFVTRSGILVHTFPVARTVVPVTVNQDLKALTPSPALDPSYIAWGTRANGSAILEQCSKDGTTVASVDTALLHSFRLPIAPLPEQRRIVEAIESYFTRLDDAVLSLERVQRNLKRYRASVLKAAVEARLVPTEAELARAEGRDYEPASVLLERILAERRRRWEEAELAKMKAKGKTPKNDKWKAKYKEPAAPETSTLPELPEGWCWATATQLCSSVRDGTHDTPAYVERGVPLVTSRHLLPGRIDTAAARHISHDDHVEISKRSRVDVGDVLFAMIGTIGNPVVVRSPMEFSIKNIALFKANTSFLSSDYLCYWLASWPFDNWLTPRLRGTTQRFASLTLLRAVPIALPPLAEQHRIVREYAAMSSIIDQEEKTVSLARAHTQRLRQSVLRWAFAGKLVDQDPSDEPAAALLGRIAVEREAATSANATKKRGRKKTRSKKA